MSVLSENLKALRGVSSQAEMAKGIGIPQQAWARYERGVVAPNAETITKICRVHACSADWLLGLDSQTSSSIVKVNGDGNTIANSPNSKISVVAPPTNCKTCQYKAAVKKLQKAGLQIPGL